MPPDDYLQVLRYAPDDPREWLNRAHSNLVQARQGSQISGVYREDLCFAAQQAAEKALKAVLIWRETQFPRIHDLAELIRLVELTGLSVPAEVRQSARLTRYAVATRYPGILEPVTQEQYEETVQTAETVVRWAAAQITGIGAAP